MTEGRHVSFCKEGCSLAAKKCDESLFAFDPDADFAGLFAGLDVNDARAAADGAIFGVGLALAATQVDGKLVGLAAKRALYDGV